MTMPENIISISDAKPDYMGFIFYDKSPRSAHGINPDIIKKISKKIKCVGVFVNESIKNIEKIMQQYALNVVQLHGKESPEMCKELGTKYEVIKSISISSEEDIKDSYAYEKSCNYLLFDTKTPSHGGSGVKFDWELISNYRGNTPFFLSGGITPEDTERVSNISHPLLYGIDINSKFETTPGVKNVEACKNFILQIRENIIK